ncbi:MAG: homocysteine S-methyltransferase family protein, partial [Clostridiales bacterium]|nr:homocysteine S-methyltransferase family protein [Clostridiales bacterium]
MSKWIILDGAMGTMLQEAGLGLGARPEVFGCEHPDILEGIHRRYIEAGSNVIYANTFGANGRKLRHSGYKMDELVAANVAAAKRAAAGQAKVALDVGPTGELMEPLGTLSFDEAYETYRDMVVAGEKAGADLVIFETMTDLTEVRAAVLAAKENSSLPIWVTMSFEETGRTFTGTLVSSMAATLDGLRVDAMGINCSLGPDEIYPLIKEMRQWTDKPLIVKPNAGLPDPATGEYAMTAEEFATQMEAYQDLGISMAGGCCGTTPEFIKALTDMLHSHENDNDETASGNKASAENNSDTISSTPVMDQNAPLRRGICSAGKMVEINGVRVIGERINPTGKKRFAQALREHDMNYIMERAIEQADAGADILDINVGLPDIDEPKMMREVVEAVQSVVSLPLQIDSPDPEAIEAGLRACCGRAIVNSVNGEEEKLHTILPIVKKYGAAVVGLTMDKEGIPHSAEKRFELAQRILAAATASGIPKDDVYIDCLTLTISAEQDQARETLKAVQMVHDRLGLHCVLGVSNISFGLPMRKYVNVSFLTQAMYCGLDLPILNPNLEEMMDAAYAFRALSGEDAQCTAYIERFADEIDEKKTAAASKAKRTDSSPSREMTLEDAILKGLREEARHLTAELLETMSEMDVINDRLIPALDIVGEKYEKQQIFLPQLINAANAASAGFELIKERIAKKGGDNVSKGKIVLATVEGDIHDIGKNIVKVVLENYGYCVIDLGRDVPVQKVVDAVIEQDAHLLGLSALMTTTVVSMK